MTPRQIRITPNAWADLRAIEAFLRREAGEGAAQKFSARVFDKLDQLTRFPQTGRSIGRVQPSVRFTTIRPWLIFYEDLSSRNLVLVRRIVDGRRDLRAMTGLL